MSENKNTTLITIVGRGQLEDNKYRKAKYCFSEKEEDFMPETTIFSKALIEYYKDELDTVIFLGTETSTWSAVLPDEGDEELNEYLSYRRQLEKDMMPITSEDFEEFKKRLRTCYSNYNVVALVQKADLSEEDIAIYAEIFAHVKPKTKIVFDITSGFRYMPLFIFESLQTYSPNIDVEDISIVYAEANGKNKPFIVRDISRAWRAAEINKALYTFQTTLDGTKLNSFIGKVDKNLAKWIKYFSEDIQKSYMALCDYKFFERLRMIISSVNAETAQISYVKETIKFLSEKILPKFEYLENISEGKRRSWCLYTFAGILYDFNLHSQAYISLRESGQMRLIEYGNPALIKRKRIKPDDLAPFEDSLKTTFQELQVEEKWYRLKKIRNYGAHAGIELIKHKEPQENFLEYQEMMKTVLENVPCKEENVSGS